MKQELIYQRAESALILTGCLYFYYHLGLNFLWFVVFIFSIDIFMLGYAAKNKKTAALVYNFGHSYILPPVLLVVGLIINSNLLIGGAIIWTAHIAMDRALGFGLKSHTGFKNTHLGKLK